MPVNLQPSQKGRKLKQSYQSTLDISPRNNYDHYNDKEIYSNQSVNDDLYNNEQQSNRKENNSRSPCKKNLRLKINMKPSKSHSQEVDWQSHEILFDSYVEPKNNYNTLNQIPEYSSQQSQLRKDYLQSEVLQARRSIQKEQHYREDEGTHINLKDYISNSRYNTEKSQSLKRDKKYSSLRKDKSVFKPNKLQIVNDRLRKEIIQLQDQFQRDKQKLQYSIKTLQAKLEMFQQMKKRNSSVANNNSDLIESYNDNLSIKSRYARDSLSMQKIMAEQQEKLEISYEVNKLLKLDMDKNTKMIKETQLAESSPRCIQSRDLRKLQQEYDKLEFLQRQQKQDFLEREINYIHQIRDYYNQSQLMKDSYVNLEKAIKKIGSLKSSKLELKKLLIETQDQLSETILENYSLIKRLPRKSLIQNQSLQDQPATIQQLDPQSSTPSAKPIDPPPPQPFKLIQMI